MARCGEHVSVVPPPAVVITGHLIDLSGNIGLHRLRVNQPRHENRISPQFPDLGMNGLLICQLIKWEESIARHRVSTASPQFPHALVLKEVPYRRLLGNPDNRHLFDGTLVALALPDSGECGCRARCKYEQGKNRQAPICYHSS